MRIKLSSSFTHEPTRQLIDECVRFGFADIDHRGVEVHVKARQPRRFFKAFTTDAEGNEVCLAVGNRRDKLNGYTDVRAFDAWYGRVPGVSGRAYDGVPSIARVAKRTAYLVTMHVPINRDGTLAKHITDERVVFVAGHEAKHVEQFQTTGYGRGTGERAANAYGNMRARRWGETHEG